MEVHHPHHTSHKKKWKEYITEFVMLFMAVTLGFFAENLRDQYLERERSHEYLVHLESDIDKNIHFIDSLVERDRQMIQKFDSAFLYLSSASSLDIDSLYKNLPVNVYRFLSKNDTYEQMKSSGSLRYVKDQHLLELILDYSNAAQAAESRSTMMETEFTTTHWVVAVSSFMSQFSAIEDYKRIRRGNMSVFQDEMFSNLYIDKDYIVFEKAIDNLPKIKTVLTGQKLQEIKNKLMPYLVRRQALIINTIKFMGQAKLKGLQLKKYMSEEH